MNKIKLIVIVFLLKFICSNVIAKDINSVEDPADIIIEKRINNNDYYFKDNINFNTLKLSKDYSENDNFYKIYFENEDIKWSIKYQFDPNFDIESISNVEFSNQACDLNILYISIKNFSNDGNQYLFYYSKLIFNADNGMFLDEVISDYENDVAKGSLEVASFLEKIKYKCSNGIPTFK